jgi:hypothetical protein
MLCIIHALFRTGHKRIARYLTIRFIAQHITRIEGNTRVKKSLILEPTRGLRIYTGGDC